MTRRTETRSSSGGVICCFDGVCKMPDAKWHGSEGGYTNHLCKCDPCRDAHADYYRIGPGAERRRAYRLRLNAAGKTTNGDPRQREYRPRPSQRVARLGRRRRSGSQAA